jgi:hypothetical protein
MAVKLTVPRLGRECELKDMYANRLYQIVRGGSHLGCVDGDYCFLAGPNVIVIVPYQDPKSFGSLVFNNPVEEEAELWREVVVRLASAGSEFLITPSEV